MNLMIKIKIFILVISSLCFGQVTGLSGWNIFLDPGHSGDENMGIYGYSEAKKNLRVAFRLKELLVNNTDIDTVYISRTNDLQTVSLSQRTSYANNVGAAWYHSIHSDAPSTTSNSTLLMYGGWRSNGITVEKTPYGGKAMADVMVDKLTRGMRTTTRGNYADRTFYQGFPYNHTNQYPYLWVNQYSTMASELSEAGFHTNPIQNQKNMNAEWKKLEAYTFYWSILQFHGITRPAVNIITGIVSDLESGTPINGATLNVDGQIYTTDTYESLFHLFTNDTNLLHNGFYFFEDVPNSAVNMIVEAPHYYPDTLQVTLNDTFFTFQDVQLVSDIPPFIKSSFPVNNDTSFSAYNDITVQFSRNMNKFSVENAFSISPVVSGSFVWYGNTKLKFKPDSLQYLTNYTLTISATSYDIYGHPLDGDKNGIGGDDFILQFKTGQEDIFPPVIISHFPKHNDTNIDLNPIINILYNEELDSSSVSDSLFYLVPAHNPQDTIPGIFEHRVINNKSLISFFPATDLLTETLYGAILNPGFRDIFGNPTSSTNISIFTTNENRYDYFNIEDFENNSTSTNWWQPQGAGQTTGIITTLTNCINNVDFLNYHTNSSNSMELNYAWDTTATSWFIREYLDGGAPKAVLFDSSYILQVYVFGDGSGTQFRFCVDDGVNFEGHEVSPWYNIDWIGWRLVSWNMVNDNLGTWIGNGVLDDTLRFDSFQLTYNFGATAGTIYFDDLRLATNVPVGIANKENNNQIPQNYRLFQNYPNPFNPSTTITYQLPKKTSVNIKVFNLLGQFIMTLVNEEKNAGIYKVEFDTKNLANGIYIYTIETEEFKNSKKMILLK